MNKVTKGLIGVGALVLGVDGGGGSDLSKQGITADAQAEEGLVFASDFRPRVPFKVVGRFSQPMTNAVVSRSSDLSDYDEYTGYLVLYMPETPGEYALVFTKETALRSGTTYRFDTDVRTFTTDLNLLSAKLQTMRRTAETATDTTTEETTTETADETATETTPEATTVSETTNETTTNETTTDETATDQTTATVNVLEETTTNATTESE